MMLMIVHQYKQHRRDSKVQINQNAQSRRQPVRRQIDDNNQRQYRTGPFHITSIHQQTVETSLDSTDFHSKLKQNLHILPISKLHSSIVPFSLIFPSILLSYLNAINLLRRPSTYIQFQHMLSVLPQQSVSMQRQEVDLAEPTSEVENMNPKQVEKKKFFTLPNILIIVVALAVLGCGGYYLFNMGKEIDVKSSISQSHDKIISHADSSKKDGSNSGSASSKSSTSNNKPNAKSMPASKGVISSNPGLTGKSGSSGDEPDPNDEDDGDKRDKKLKKGSSTSGGSTIQDSEEEQDDEEEENVDDGVYWVDTKLEGNNASPLVGTARP